jgi:hypothetical protein
MTITNNGPYAFWLVSCGALIDAEPFGEEFVRQTCHEIEAVAKHFRLRPVFHLRTW